MEDAALVVVAVLAVTLLLVHAATHVPFFDETVHARYLWLLSSGLKPEVDFFSHYPIAGHALSVPLMKLLPDSAYSLIPLRGISLAAFGAIACLYFRHGRRLAGDGASGLIPLFLVATAPGLGPFLVEYSIDPLAALAGIAALTLLFCPLRPLNAALACAFSLVSVAITPKYVFPLSFGLLGAIAAYRIRKPEDRAQGTASAAVAGSAVALILVVLLYKAAGAPMRENFRLSFVLMAKYISATGSSPSSVLPSETFQAFLSYNPLLAGVLVVGVSGWVRYVRRNPAPERLQEGGILLGASVMPFVVGNVIACEQYQVPVLFCMALFMPYAYPERARRGPGRWFRPLLLTAAGITILARVLAATGEFRETPLNVRSSSSLLAPHVGVVMSSPFLSILERYETCLRLVPRDERVVAVWPFHPIFRRDQTWVTWDESPSFALFLDAGDPARRNFDPDVFRDSLERRWPALIVPTRLEANYPPGWQEVCADFLRRHPEAYRRENPMSDGVFLVRRDLQHPGP
jgi:hypothetical protein